MKILVVDDTRANLAVISLILEKMGAQAIPAASGKEALEIFGRERPDLVLLDVILPDISGYDVARRIRQGEAADEWTPIIFLSGQTADSDLEEGIAAGGDDYLHKPVNAVVLGAKIKAMQRIVSMRDSLVTLTRQLDSANQELQRLSSRDGLTGIGNRRSFDEALLREWGRATRNGGEIALMLCDVDHFKRFNDTYGHQAGDECLKRVAQALQASVGRSADVVARYGGEEFVVVLPDTGIGGMLFVAEKARHAVRQLAIPHSGSSHGRVTISVGIAALRPDGGEAPGALIEAADRALYRAKGEGRDQVRKYDPAIDRSEARLAK